jgi:hypothetical protein
MNFTSNTALFPSTTPSSVAAIQRITGWRTHLWTSLDLPGRALVPAPIHRFDRQSELDDEVAGKVLWLGLPLFSRHRRRRASSLVPMIIRASEPPIKVRLFREFSVLLPNGAMNPLLARAAQAPPASQSPPQR